MSKKKRVFIIGSTLFLLVGAFLYLQPIKVGAVSVFTSGQLAPSAVNGYILSTNGTANSWIANTSSLFPFTPQSWGNSTSTTLGFLNGFVSTASSTFSNLGTGAVYTQNGLLLSHASTSLSVAYQDVWRDGNANVFANNFIPGLTTTSASGGTVVLTPASTRYQMLTGSNNHTYQMPNGNASGMNTGATWEFNNDTANGFVLHVQTHGGVFIADVPNGGYVKVILTDNGTSEGSWETHALLGHNNVSSTNALGLGTTTPYAQLSIHANANAPTIYQTLFSIGSSTASATTTLFSISNTGAITTSLGTGCVTATAGLLSAGSACGTVTSVTATAPLFSSGGATPNLTWFGLSTTSALTQGQLLYNTTNGNGVASVATSSVTINAPLTGTIVGVGTGLSLSCTTASAGVTGCLSGTDYNTFAAKESALTFTTPLIRTANTINWVGLATTSQPASSNLLVSNGTNGVYGVATTSASCSGTVSCTAFTVLGSSPITITGSASGGSFPFTATTNFGGVVYATSTPSLWFQAGTYASSTSYMDNLQLGSSTITSIFPNNPLYIGGQQNNYIQQVIQNRSNGNNASGVLSIHDDRGTDTTYYTEFGINSSGYSQATFASQNAGDAFLNVSDGALVIGTASTTNSLADLRFTTGGTASSSIRMIIRQGGLIGIGTTTPVLGALTIATSTAPQLVLSAGAGLSSWTTRNSFGTLYFATTSITAPNATSTVSALSINTNGVVNFAIPPTRTGGTNSGTGGFAFVTSPTLATPTFTTSFTSPIHIGGSAVSSTLILRSTSGVGTSDAIIFQTGNSIETARFNTKGNFGIGTTTPSGFAKVTISTSSPQLLLTDGTATSIPFAFRSFGGSFFLATTSPSAFATSTNSIFTIIAGGFSGLFGFGTSTPFYPLTVDNGSIHVAQNKPATSTSMTLSGTTANDFVLRMGTASYTVTITNMRPGQKMTVDTCNPGSTGGAVTWSGVQWDSGTVPTQVTTANKCQTWYFRGTFGTSTPLIVGYPASSGF